MNVDIRICRREEAQEFLEGHALVVPGPVACCSCGWVGVDFPEHRRSMLVAWLELKRRALRARLLAEEGVIRP